MSLYLSLNVGADPPLKGGVGRDWAMSHHLMDVTGGHMTYLVLLVAEQRAYFRNMKPRKIKLIDYLQNEELKISTPADML